MTADVARAANARQVQLEASLSSLLEIADRRGCASLEHARAVAVLRALGRHGEAAALLVASKESGADEARLLVCKAIYQSQLTIAVALAPEAKNTVADPEKDTEKE